MSAAAAKRAFADHARACDQCWDVHADPEPRKREELCETGRTLDLTVTAALEAEVEAEDWHDEPTVPGEPSDKQITLGALRAAAAGGSPALPVFANLYLELGRESMLLPAEIVGAKIVTLGGESRLLLTTRPTRIDQSPSETVS
jgi:hypothetical protein